MEIDKKLERKIKSKIKRISAGSKGFSEKVRRATSTAVKAVVKSPGEGVSKVVAAVRPTLSTLYPMDELKDAIKKELKKKANLMMGYNTSGSMRGTTNMTAGMKTTLPPMGATKMSTANSGIGSPGTL